jgi:hypothetical protein
MLRKIFKGIKSEDGEWRRKLNKDKVAGSCR